KMSSSETSSPSRRKKPSSTAAAAGKYEFEITSGTASFIVHPLAHPGASIGSIRAIVMSMQPRVCGLAIRMRRDPVARPCAGSQDAWSGADPAFKLDSPEERNAHQGTKRSDHAHRRGNAGRRVDAALLAASRFVGGAFRRYAGSDAYLR